MITFRDPPPLRVRVQSLKEPAVAPPTFDAPIVPFLILMTLVIFGGILVSAQKHRRDDIEALHATFSNSLRTEIESGVAALMPVGAPMEDVRARLNAIHATCRSAAPIAAQDSVLVCLGDAIVRDNSYSRYAIRFTSRRGRLVSLNACPTLVHWKSRAISAELAARFAEHVDRGCWRDEANVADNEWSFGVLPDHAFTTAVVHAADTVTRRARPTADTLIVSW